MKILFFILLITSNAFMNQDAKILVLHTYSAIDKNILDQNDISTINMLYTQGLKKYINNIKSSNVICKDDQCALDELSKTKNDKVIYSRLQKLGSKIIFSSSIIDHFNSFESKATAQNVEDMERICLRLSKSIALRESIEEVADIDNIIDEEEKEPTRRKSLGRFGMSLGVLYPFGNSFSHHFIQNSNETENVNIKMGFHWYNEFKNNTAFLIEYELYRYTMGLSASLLKFSNKADTSPFYGGRNALYSYEELTKYNSNSAVGINIQGGALLYRTYNFNIFVRAKYVQMFNNNSDNGITLDIGIQKKFQSNQKKNKTTIINRYPILEAIFGN